MSYVKQGGSGLITFDNVGSTTVLSYTPVGTGRLITVSGSHAATGAVSSLTSVVDNQSNSYTIKHGGNSGSGEPRGWVAYLASNGSGITSITLTFQSAGPNYGNADVSEWSGQDASPEDVSTTATGANPLATGTINPTVPDCLVIVACGSDDAVTSSWAANSGWTTLCEQGDTTAHSATKAMYKIQVGSSSESATMNYQLATHPDSSIIIAFKPTSSAGNIAWIKG